MFGAMAMTTLTIRLPDDTAARLKSLARSRGLSTNKLVEELVAPEKFIFRRDLVVG
jgi:predicted transcriptional regulator